MSKQLIKITDVMALAGVSRQAITNWIFRYRDSATPFPSHVSEEPTTRRRWYRRREVVAWLEATGRLKTTSKNGTTK